MVLLLLFDFFFHSSVPSFEASEYPISNLEFYQFIKAGGYENQDYWTKEGWKWRTYREAKHPMFWVCNSGINKFFVLNPSLHRYSVSRINNRQLLKTL